jgi:hypothetical protein
VGAIINVALQLGNRSFIYLPIQIYCLNINCVINMFSVTFKTKVSQNNNILITEHFTHNGCNAFMHTHYRYVQHLHIYFFR